MTNKIEAKDVYSKKVGDLYDEGDISCNPTPRYTLLDLAAEHGVVKDSLVLDIGCANGGASRKLMERTGCRIEGVELLEFLVKMGQEENKKLGVDERFVIQQGNILDIPFEDNNFDFVFCNDVIGMVKDVPKALAECRRVLKPNGKMLIYLSFPTELLSEKEEQELEQTQGGETDRALRETQAEEYIKESFKIVKKLVIGSQFAQQQLENNPDESEAISGLVRIARLRTWPDKYINKYGKQAYRIVLAGSHWSLYILLGKLQPTVFIVQKD